MLFYRAALPLSSRTLTFVAGAIRRHRAAIGSPWRKLNPGQQALLVLVYLRKGETFAELAAGFGVGTTTAWRYVNETTDLLAARAPKLRTAVRDAVKAGYAYVVLDGTLIPVDRVAADRPFYSGKHKRHGMNLQVIASPCGNILWVSGPLPGAVHDKRAEWIWGVLAELEAAGLVVLADKGYQGSTYAKIPYRGRNKPDSQKQANKAHAQLRAPGERANAQLKSWLYCASAAARCACGSHQCDPGVGDVVSGARQGEGLQGAGGKCLGAAGVAVAQQELCARLPYLRAFQGFAEAFRELFGLGEVALGFVAIACAEPRSSQRVQALQDAARVGNLAAQPERFTVVVLGCGPFLFGLGDSTEVGEDGAVDHAVAVGFGQALQEFQGITESGLGGPDVAAEVFGGGHDAVTAGAQAGI